MKGELYDIFTNLSISIHPRHECRGLRLETQVKTIKSNKNANSITRSCLFDTKSRRSNEEWDQLHNTSTQKIDSFIFVDTHSFEQDGSVYIVWIGKNEFNDMMRKHTREQEDAEFKKTWRQIRPSWEMPISIDKKMWVEIKNKCK